MTKIDIDRKIYDLYDEYCHGYMSRREFLNRASAITVAGISGLAMAQALLPCYAEAQIISFTDDRIKANYVEYESPGGTMGDMRGYIVRPTTESPFPSVIVIHENRGLNPYIEDVARRFAVEGFLALAPDGLSPVGGYPGNDDDGRALQRSLDQTELKRDMLNSAMFLKSHELSRGKLGAVGFLLGWWHNELSCRRNGRRSVCSRPFLRSRPKKRRRSKNSGVAIDSASGGRSEDQRHVA